MQAYRRWHKRVTFLGIIYQDSPSQALAFTRQNGGGWQDLIDPHSSTAINYGLSGMPSTYFINAQGIVTDFTESLLPNALNQGLWSAMAPS